MSEAIKMTENELAEVRMLQEKFQQKVFQLGQLYLQKLNVEVTIKGLNEQEIKLRDDWVSLQKMENELIEKLLAKYGEGRLDLSKGSFIKDEKTPS